MAVAISGVDVVVNLYEENTFGSGSGMTPSIVTATKRQVSFSSVDVGVKQNLIDSPIIVSGRGTTAPGLGNLDVSGSLETTIAPNTIGLWLKHLLGTHAVTGTTIFTHTFTIGELPVSLCLEKDYSSKITSGQRIERFTGLRIKGAEFNFDQEGFATARFDMVGKGHGMYNDPAASGNALRTHTGWTGFSGELKKDGNQKGGITKMVLRVDNQMPGGPYCFPDAYESAGERRSNPEGSLKLSGSINLMFEADSFELLGQATAGVADNWSIIYKTGDGLGSAGNEKITFSLSNVMFNRTSPPINTPAGLELSLDFIAYGTSNPLQIVVLNSVAL